MRRSLHTMLGVTLLEVMLVLSIIALIILMSVRYYQSASNASQITQVLNQIQAITAAMDNLSAGTTTGYTGINPSSITSLAGASVLTSPWGAPITVGATETATTYTVSIGSVPAAVCTGLKNKLSTNTKYTSVTCSGGTFSYTYNTTT